MEHDHRIVQRVAQNGEQRSDGVRVHLAAHQRVHAHDQHEVVQQRHDGGDAHLVFEADGDVDDDEHDGHEERDERRLDDAGAPVGSDGGHLEAVGGQPQLVRHLVRALRGLFGARRCGLLARGAARVLGSLFGLDRVDGLARFGRGHARALGGGKRLVVLRSGHAVLDAPEARVLRDDLRRQQADERRLEQQHHGDVAQDAQRQRQAEALDGSACEEEQRQRRHERHEVGVHRRHDGVLHARHGRGAHAAAHADFLAEALHGEDGRVGRHADGEHDAGDAGERQAEQAERRQRGQDAQVQHREHDHSRRGDEAEAAVEEQQVQHDHRKADERHEHAGRERVLTERRADGLALRVLEAHGQRTAFEHGLQRLRLVERVAARDGHVAGNLVLHGGRLLHFAVEDDDDLAVRGQQVLGGCGECSRAVGIEREVHSVVGGRLRMLADGHVRDVGARDDGRVRALLHLEVLCLARGQGGYAQVVGDGALAGRFAVLDLRLHVLVGERVEAGEFELAGFADGVERVLGVREAGDLHEDLIGALHLHDRLRGAERVHAALDDGAALLHVVVGHGSPVGALRGEHHRQAALDVEALVDLLLRRQEHEHRPEDQQGRDDEQPDVAPVGGPGGFLLRLLRCRHVTFSLVELLVCASLRRPRADRALTFPLCHN